MLAAPFRARLHGTDPDLISIFFFVPSGLSLVEKWVRRESFPAAATESTVQVEARDALGQKKTTQNKELIEFEIVVFVLIFMFQCFFCSST